MIRFGLVCLGSVRFCIGTPQTQTKHIRFLFDFNFFSVQLITDQFDLVRFDRSVFRFATEPLPPVVERLSICGLIEYSGCDKIYKTTKDNMVKKNEQL